MSKVDMENINVLNYNENEVFVDSAKEHYKFSASRDGKTPSVISMPLSELQTICTNTDIFVTGWLTFDDDVKEEIFNELRISNWRDILTNEDIENILTHPTLEGLQRIVDIDNQTYFDRVRIIMFKLMTQGVDISTRVHRIVEQRYDELRRRQRRSSIVLTKKDMRAYATSNDIKDLSEQNALLQSQLDEMKQLISQMLDQNSGSKLNIENTDNVIENDDINSENDIDNSETKVNSTPKRVGRPKKTT